MCERCLSFLTVVERPLDLYKIKGTRKRIPPTGTQMFYLKLNSSKGMFMQDEQRERLKTLCQYAANEYHPQKLIELLQEINKLLSEERRRSMGATNEN